MTTRRAILHLEVRVPPDRQQELIRFLQEAVPFYEQPGDITVRLLRQRDDPGRLIEVIEYDSWAAHDRDQERMERDRVALRLLERWRGLLDEPPTIVRFDELTPLLRSAAASSGETPAS